MRKSKIIYSILIIIYLSVFTNVVNAETFDVNKLSNITINYKIENQNYANKKINIYKIADLNEKTEFITLSEYIKYNVDFNDIKDSSEWNSLSQVVLGIIKNDKIVPTSTLNTNENGIVVFKDLKAGMYLIETEITYEKYKTIIYDPFLISLPNIQGNYDVNINPKGVVKIPEYEEKEYKIVKYWNDENEKNRPQNIEITIFKDGVEADRIVLSKENNWSYIWKALDDGSIWSVIENNIPNGYKISLENNESSFYITNTYTNNDNKTNLENNNQNLQSKDISNPKTGEEITIFIFISMAVISIIGLIVITFINRRLGNE